VENPLTSLADDARRTQQMVKQIDGPVLLVGHSYGGAVITEAGDLPNVVGLVYIAAFAPDAGEGLGAVTEQMAPPVVANISSNRDGSVRSTQHQLRERICRELPAERSRRGAGHRTQNRKNVAWRERCGVRGV